MTPAAEKIVASLADSDWQALTARQALTRFNLGFNQTDDVLEELVAHGVLVPPVGDRSLDRVYEVIPGGPQRALAGPSTASVALDFGPRSRLSGLAERRFAA